MKKICKSILLLVIITGTTLTSKSQLLFEGKIDELTIRKLPNPSTVNDMSKGDSFIRIEKTNDGILYHSGIENSSKQLIENKILCRVVSGKTLRIGKVMNVVSSNKSMYDRSAIFSIYRKSYNVLVITFPSGFEGGGGQYEYRFSKVKELNCSEDEKMIKNKQRTEQGSKLKEKELKESKNYPKKYFRKPSSKDVFVFYLKVGSGNFKAMWGSDFKYHQTYYAMGKFEPSLSAGIYRELTSEANKLEKGQYRVSISDMLLVIEEYKQPKRTEKYRHVRVTKIKKYKSGLIYKYNVLNNISDRKFKIEDENSEGEEEYLHENY